MNCSFSNLQPLWTQLLFSPRSFWSCHTGLLNVAQTPQICLTFVHVVLLPGILFSRYLSGLCSRIILSERSSLTTLSKIYTSPSSFVPLICFPWSSLISYILILICIFVYYCPLPLKGKLHKKILVFYFIHCMSQCN